MSSTTWSGGGETPFGAAFAADSAQGCSPVRFELGNEPIQLAAAEVVGLAFGA